MTKYAGFYAESNAGDSNLRPCTHFGVKGSEKTLCGLKNKWMYDQEVEEGEEPTCMNCRRVFRARKAKGGEAKEK